jgi:hypothetical protein
MYLYSDGEDESMAFLGGSDSNYYNGELKYVKVAPIAALVYGIFGYLGKEYHYGFWQVEMSRQV